MAVPKHLRTKNKDKPKPKPKLVKSKVEKQPEPQSAQEEQTERSVCDDMPTNTVKPNLRLLHKKKLNSSTEGSLISDSQCGIEGRLNESIDEIDEVDESYDDAMQHNNPPPPLRPSITSPTNTGPIMSQSPPRSTPQQNEISNAPLLDTRGKSQSKEEPTISPGCVRKSLTLLKKRGSVSRLRSAGNLNNLVSKSDEHHLPSPPLQPPIPPQPPSHKEEEVPLASASKGPHIKSSGRSQLPPESEFADESPYDSHAPAQRECPNCHRKFNPQPFEKHVPICAKVFTQKRAAFDASKKRAEGIPDLKEVQQSAKKGAMKNRSQGGGTSSSSSASSSAAAAKKAKWKADSEMFRAAMKAGKAVSSAIASGSALPEHVPSAPDPSLVPCPSCGRTFNEKAAERHIPQCKSIRAKPTSLKKGSGGAGGKIGDKSGGGLNKRRSTIL